MLQTYRGLKFLFQNSLANWKNMRAEATNMSQSRTVCASRKSWNASQLTTKSKKLAAIMSRLSVFNMFSLFTNDLHYQRLGKARLENGEQPKFSNMPKNGQDPTIINRTFFAGDQSQTMLGEFLLSLLWQSLKEQEYLQ
jgi:hypothetical protein